MSRPVAAHPLASTGQHPAFGGLRPGEEEVIAVLPSDPGIAIKASCRCSQHRCSSRSRVPLLLHSIFQSRHYWLERGYMDQGGVLN